MGEPAASPKFDLEPQKECELFGDFGMYIQGILGVVCFGSLLCKFAKI